VTLELTHVTNPPDVIADAVGFLVAPMQLPPRQFLTDLDGLQHRAFRVTRTACIVNLRHPWVLEELPEHRDQIVTVDVVSNLLPLVAENGVIRPGHGTFGEIHQKPMQLDSGVRWLRERWPFSFRSSVRTPAPIRLRLLWKPRTNCACTGQCASSRQCRTPRKDDP